MHTLYRFYGRGDVLLYVGITNLAVYRMAQHIQGRSWFPLVERTMFEHCDNRMTAKRRERDAIENEKPLFNDIYNRPRKVRRLSPAEFERGYTLVEAGQISGLSPNTLRAQIKNGVLPAVKVGKTFLVRAKDLDHYIRDHRGRAGRPRRRTTPQEPK